MHTTETRFKRRDGARVAEANVEPSTVGQAREGVERRRRFCGRAARVPPPRMVDAFPRLVPLICS